MQCMGPTQAILMGGSTALCTGYKTSAQSFLPLQCRVHELLHLHIDLPTVDCPQHPALTIDVH